MVVIGAPEPASPSTIYGGANSRGSFATAVLAGIGAPVNTETMTVLMAQMRVENTSSAFNPMATTQGAPGATNANSVGVKNYPDFNTGVSATVQTLMNGYYDNYIAGLRAGNQENANQIVSDAAQDLNTWGSGGVAVLSLVDSTRGNLGYYTGLPIGASDSGNPGGSGASAESTGLSLPTPIPGINIDPFNILGNAAKNPLGALAGIYQVFAKTFGFADSALKFLTNVHTWVRFGMLLAGAALVAMAWGIYKDGLVSGTINTAKKGAEVAALVAA